MEYVSRRALAKKNVSWSSVAFIVESILLLVFLVASLAVLTQVFTNSLNRSIESRSADAATIAASSIAEHFAADPTGVEEQTKLGDLIVICDVSSEPRRSGTLYHATISVYSATGANGPDPVYSLETARYVGNTTTLGAVNGNPAESGVS